MEQQAVEKCEKRRCPGDEASRWNPLRGEVYSINGSGATLEMRACSACAGDYEDPDRTAWTPAQEEEDEPGGAGRETTEEFPAEE
jgi:hypothetical protein